MAKVVTLKKRQRLPRAGFLIEVVSDRSAEYIARSGMTLRVRQSDFASTIAFAARTLASDATIYVRNMM